MNRKPIILAGLVLLNSYAWTDCYNNAEASFINHCYDCAHSCKQDYAFTDSQHYNEAYIWCSVDCSGGTGGAASCYSCGSYTGVYFTSWSGTCQNNSCLNTTMTFWSSGATWTKYCDDTNPCGL